MSQEVDAIVEALREDPVLLHPVFGNGRTEEVRAGLNEIVEELDFPAYVVMVPRPAGLSESDPDRELASLLHTRIGGDGVYLVQTDPAGYGQAVVSFGDVPSADQRHTLLREHYPDGGSDVGLSAVGVAARDLELIGAGDDITGDELDAYTEQTIWREPPEWDLEYEEPTAGSFAVFTTMAFVAVAGCGWLVLRNLARWRETAPVVEAPAAQDAAVPAAGPVQVRALAERELDELAQRHAATAGRSQPSETRELVDGSYDTARAVLERAGDDDEDLDELVGALVLARIATRVLTRKRGVAALYRPCFFDPRHGEGVRRRTVPVGDRDLSVPACSACGQLRAQELAPMTVPGGRLGRKRPWYEHDTVWARTGYGAFVDDLWQHVSTDQRASR